MQYFLDSLKQIASGEVGKTFQIKPFNSNFLTDYRSYALGMSVEKIDQLLTFRNMDQWGNLME